MTDFVLESSTDIETSNLRSLKIKRPKASIEIPFYWDLKRDRPQLQEIHESGISFGTGCSFTIGVNLRCTFTNIWDVSISFKFIFEGKFGAEFYVPDDCTIEFDEKEIKSKSFPIINS